MYQLLLTAVPLVLAFLVIVRNLILVKHALWFVRGAGQMCRSAR